MLDLLVKVVWAKQLSKMFRSRNQDFESDCGIACKVLMKALRFRCKASPKRVMSGLCN